MGLEEPEVGLEDLEMGLQERVKLPHDCYAVENDEGGYDKGEEKQRGNHLDGRRR